VSGQVPTGQAVLDTNPSYPADGGTPELKPIRVTVGGATIDVPTVVAHVFIVGSGPIGCAFARNLLDRPTTGKIPSVAIAEIGSQEGAIKGRNLKNSLKYQKDIDAFVHVIKGHLQPISVVPSHPVMSMYGNNPNQDRQTNLQDSAVTRTVGGMATHWTCCCPKPHAEERNASPISDTDFNPLFNLAGTYLTVHDNVFDPYIRHTIVKETLKKAFPNRNIGNLPLGVRDRNASRNYLTWAGSDTVLETSIRTDVKTVVDKMLWLTETRVTELNRNTANNSIRAAVARDYNQDSDVLIIAKNFVIASGAIGTPQILYRSGITPPALGRYLSEQSVAFCQIVLKRSIFDSTQYLSNEQIVRRDAHIAAHPRDVPIPLDDLEPQVYIPYETSSPWHVQIHRDAFSYGDLGPTVDPRLIVDLRFFGKSETKQENRVYFGLRSTNEQMTEWKGGDTDIYGMPQPTFEVTRTQGDLGRDEKMMEDMKTVAQKLGEYLTIAQPKFMNPGLALHITGTTRMQPKDATEANKRQISVVDTESKVHDYDNLWLGGCNVIPDAMACNPTRTAMAYAIKSAGAIYKKLYS
jgi:pyranose oxidase